MFDYSKLNGKIKEVFDTQEAFAKAMGLSAVSINKRLNNKITFTQLEILKAVKLLNIDFCDVDKYFFTEKVEKTQ